jgi:hypothetical protein
MWSPLIDSKMPESALLTAMTATTRTSPKIGRAAMKKKAVRDLYETIDVWSGM